MRAVLVALHRGIALVLGAWFALLGLTGAVVVWQAELDAALNPQWFASRPACGDAPSQPVATALGLFEAGGGRRAATVMAPAGPGAAYVVWEKGPGGTRRQHFVDVNCRLHLGTRDWGAARVDRPHLVPALYELHRSLLSGEPGHTAVGSAGLALIAVVLAGAVAAAPRRTTAANWARALTLKRGAAAPRRVYDLHRAGGLWLLPFLGLMAISGAYLCFPQPGRAVVATVLPTLPGGWRAPDAARGAGTEDPDALARFAQSLWPGARWSRIQLPGRPGDPHELRLLQPGEPRADTGDTRVRLGPEGRVLAVRDPLAAPAGDALLGWLFPLHSGEALGRAGRLAWTVLGLAPAALFATGLWLRQRRRRALRPSPRRDASTSRASLHS